MRAFYSDVTDDVIIVQLEDGESQEFTIEEFIECYGEDALPLTAEEKRRLDILHCYYNAAEYMCKMSGEYASANKMQINANDGVYRVQVAKYHSYGKQGNADAHLEQAISDREEVFRKSIKLFDKASREAGFKPLSIKDMELLFQKLYENKYEFRRKLREQIRKNHKNEEFVSISDMVSYVYELIKKPHK